MRCEKKDRGTVRGVVRVEGGFWRVERELPLL